MRTYLTAAEFQNHPTGLNLQDLVPGGTAQQQTAELTLLIQQASSMTDAYTYQPLYARTVTETQAVSPDAVQRLRLRCRDFPVQTVSAIQYKTDLPANWQTADIANTVVMGDPQGAQWIWVSGTGNFWGRAGLWGNPVVSVQYTYIAGYANMQLTAPASVGDTTLTVDNTLGVTSGDTVTLYDGVSLEEATVASTTATTLTLNAGLQYAHAVGIRVAELPGAVTLATIYATAWLIKERRAGGGLMMSGKVQPTNLQTSEDMQFFRQLLLPYRRVI